MYPLIQWSYHDLCARLNVLEGNQLYPELVIVSNQLTEQVVKRHLIREINLQRRYWHPKNKVWVNLTNSKERDGAIKIASEPNTWKPMWRKLLHEERGLPTIDEAFIYTGGSNAWVTLILAKPIPLLPNQQQSSKALRFGFRECRHRLVHGTTSPPTHEIEQLALWGANLIKNMLHPERGWPLLLRWNAQTRLPAFRAKVHKSVTSQILSPIK